MITLLASFRALHFLASFAASDPVLGANPAIPANLQITTYASGLNFPYGLFQLPDGSILAATGNGGLGASQGVQIVRITETNGLGNTPTVVFSAGAGPVTGLAGVGNIVTLAIGTNTGSKILILQAGTGGALTQIGALNFTYPVGFWDHDSHAIALRAVAGQPNSYQLVFSVGSQLNDGPSVGTVSINGVANATLDPNSIYGLTFSVNGGAVTGGAVTEMANGLRNAFALGFSKTGDIYFGENGIDFQDSNVPVSTDYFGIIPNGTSSVLNFGFPYTYYDATTGQMVGPAAGITQPFAKFLPMNGMATQGVGGLAVAPVGFPPGLNNGVFFGFFGRHADGANNNLDGVVYVDATTGNYFDFIPNSQPGISHPVSFLATNNALYIADLSTIGDDGRDGYGAIFRVSIATVPEPATFALAAPVVLLVVAVRRRRARQTLRET